MKVKTYFAAALMAAFMLPQVSYSGNMQENAKSKEEKMQWWKDAKFGMFIHWGIYSVPAGKWCGRTSYGEWIMHQASLSRDTYSGFADKFNPKDFNAEEWVKLAKEAGQKYIVITSKHHDGFAMFKSEASKYNVVDATPFKRDVIEELASACRKHGMKLGLYYSQAQDWYHPGGARHGGKLWDNGQKGDMMEYIKKIALPQVKEILSKYGDIAVLWWDTPTDMTPEMSKMFGEVIAEYPNLITNNRLGGGVEGDLETPEQYIPATGYKDRNWEVCMTMNGHWGYNAYDDNWKSTRELLRNLVDIVSKGGNFLLNVGPDSQGRIPGVCIGTLKDIGEWMSMNGESIYGTESSPIPYLSWGRATRKGNTLYMHIFDWGNGYLQIPLENKVKRAYLLADRKHNLEVKHSANGLSVKLPEYAPDRNVSVLALELDGAPEVSPAPSYGKPVDVTVESKKESCSILTDNNSQTIWNAPKGKKTADIVFDLKKKEKICAMILSEIWKPWDKMSQEYELMYLKGNDWVSICKGKTRGTGHTAEFSPVESRYFKLTLKTRKNSPALGDIMLCR